LTKKDNKTTELLAMALLDKKAEDVLYIDISSVSVIADGFLIASGRSTVHVKALCDEIQDKCRDNGIEVFATEGYSAGRWIIVDLGDIMVHVFHREDREFYNLERLWNQQGNVREYAL